MNGRTGTQPRAPLICASFFYRDLEYQVVAWPETDDEPFEWDVVRADDPYIWRDRQVYA